MLQADSIKSTRATSPDDGRTIDTSSHWRRTSSVETRASETRPLWADVLPLSTVPHPEHLPLDCAPSRFFAASIGGLHGPSSVIVIVGLVRMSASDTSELRALQTNLPTCDCLRPFQLELQLALPPRGRLELAYACTSRRARAPWPALQIVLELAIAIDTGSFNQFPRTLLRAPSDR